MKDKFKFIFSMLWVFFAPLIKEMMTDAGLALAEAAQKAVQRVELELKGEPGEVKRSEAYKLILADLKRQGVETASRFVNAAIEAAVIKMQTK